MNRLQKRGLASIAAWALLNALATVLGVVILDIGEGSREGGLITVLLVITLPSTFGAICWELGRRRIWLAILLVAVIPSLLGMLLALFLSPIASGSLAGSYLSDTIGFFLMAAVLGQVGQFLCIPAAVIYWVTSHFILTRLDGHPIKRLKQSELDDTFK